MNSGLATSQVQVSKLFHICFKIETSVSAYAAAVLSET